MQRDLERLQRHAELVQADLGRTLEGEWTCVITQELVLRVTGPTWEGVVELSAEADDDDLADYEAESLEDALEFDAAEAIADQISELLGNTAAEWPWCDDHSQHLEVDGVSWNCPDGHQVAPIGDLTRRPDQR